jgi:hypothetical protein
MVVAGVAKYTVAGTRGDSGGIHGEGTAWRFAGRRRWGTACYRRLVLVKAMDAARHAMSVHEREHTC